MRNYSIDLLRCFGLMMIILAHMSPPALLFQLRNFDVPLMVLLSGVSFAISHRAGGSYGDYVYKRFKRLILPVWVFLTAFFLLLFLGAPGHAHATWSVVFESFFLLEGIGYVWIIRVFFLVALVAPWLHALSERIAFNGRYFLLLLAIGAGYELVVYGSSPYLRAGVVSDVVREFVFYLIPYSLIYAIGLRLLRLPRVTIVYLLVFFSLGFLAFGFGHLSTHGHFVQTQDYKYPVTFYYFAYALAVSLAGWLYADRVWNAFGPRARRITLFMSYNSIWIYLWHIPLVYWCQYVGLSFPLSYLFTLALAVITTYGQGLLVNYLLLPRIKSKAVAKEINTIIGVTLHNVRMAQRAVRVRAEQTTAKSFS